VNVSEVTEFCIFANLDIHIFLEAKQMPLVDMLFRSIETFMPCYNEIHLTIPEGELARFIPHLGGLRNVYLHPRVKPPVLAALNPYVLGMWDNLWADNYTSEKAQYVMFLDTDTVFSLPVTCASIFDEDGRPIWNYWSWGLQRQFQSTCERMLGPPCAGSFMSFFPMVMPISALPRMRERVIEVMNVTTFDEAVATFYANIPRGDEFCQFCLMGNFLLQFESWANESSNTYCDFRNAVADHINPCLYYIPPAVHLGWTYGYYVGEHTGFLARKKGGCFDEWTDKMSSEYVKAVEELTRGGLCFARAWKGHTPNITSPLTGIELPPGCSEDEILWPHELTVAYPRVRRHKDPKLRENLLLTYTQKQNPGWLCSDGRRQQKSTILRQPYEPNQGQTKNPVLYFQKDGKLLG